MTPYAATLWLLALGASQVAAAQSAASGTAAASAPLVKPGLWETTTVIEDGAAATRRSIVGRTCVQAVDATRVQQILPVQRERDTPCENRDVRHDGSAWTWTVSCRSADATRSGVGRMVLSGDSYLGRAELDVRRKGAKAVKVQQTFSGKWIQPCG